MNKRIVSAILALTFLMSCFALTSFAFDEEVEPVVSKDFEFAKAVGIFSDEYIPNEAISRIELARCFSNIILKGVEPATDYGSVLFDDVDISDSGYADAMAGAGIMNGVGGRSFQPDGNVTYMQLLKVFVSFLGYDVKAQGLGGYPSGYMAVANELGLTDVNAPYIDSYVTYETLATMFKVALRVPLFRIISYRDGTFIYIENQNTDYLKEYLNIYRYSQVVNAVYNTNIINARELQHDEIILGSTLFRFDAKTSDLYEKLGYKLEVFYKKDGANANIIFYDEYDNNVITLDGEDVEGYHDGSVLYSEGNKERRIKITTETNVIYNGKLCSVYDEDIFNQWRLTNKDGSLKAIDNNGDRNYDFVIIDAYESYVVDTITEDVIIPRYRSSAVIDISAYNQGLGVLFRNIKGKPVSIESVVPGSVISVSKDMDDVVTNIVVTADTYTGEVDTIEVEDGKYYVTIGGRRYNPSACLAFNPQISRLRPGNRVTMMFNKDGLLSDIETLKYQQIDTAYLMACKTGSGLEASDSASIRFLSSGGFFGTYSFAKRVEVLHGDEILHLKPVEVLDIFGYEGDKSEGKIKRQPFMYKKNEEGQINWINIIKEGSGPLDGIYKYENIGLTANPRYYGGSFEGKILVSGSAIFCVPTEENRDDESYYITRTSLANRSYSGVEIYGSKKESRIAEAVVIISTSPAANITSSVMVVDSITDALDPEGIPSVKVKGYVSKVMEEYYCTKADITDENGNMPGPGDVISIKVGREEKIIEHKVLFDRDMKKLTGSSNPTTTDFADSERYLYGRVDWSDSESFVVEIDDGNGNLTKDVYLKGASYEYYICQDLGKNGVSIKSAKPAEVFAYPEEYTKENRIFMWTYYASPRVIVIYK